MNPLTSPPEEPVEEDVLALELDFDKDSVVELDPERRFVTNPLRWDRVRDEINFQDLVEEFTGKRSNDKISCPFHGSDTTPSFGFWPHKNNGFCFGCPPGEQYYDPLIFTSKYLQISPYKALLWLEKTYSLPPLDDIVPEEEEEEEEISLEFCDLAPAYIVQARREIRVSEDPELAFDYLRIYYESQHINDPLPLAKVLDPDTLRSIKQKKLYR